MRKHEKISELTEKFNFIFSDLNSRFKPYIILVLKNFLVILKIIFYQELESVLL